MRGRTITPTHRNPETSDQSAVPYKTQPDSHRNMDWPVSSTNVVRGVPGRACCHRERDFGRSTPLVPCYRLAVNLQDTASHSPLYRLHPRRHAWRPPPPPDPDVRPPSPRAWSRYCPTLSRITPAAADGDRTNIERNAMRLPTLARKQCIKACVSSTDGTVFRAPAPLANGILVAPVPAC